LVATTFAGLLHPREAIAGPPTPKIQILNPVDRTADGGTPPDTNRPVLSDKATSQDERYTLSAWVKDPPGPVDVKFQVGAGPVVEADRVVAGDTHEVDWNIPGTVSDGPATLTANLYAEGTNTLLATDVEQVSVMNGTIVPQKSPAIDLVYPTGNGKMGFYSNGTGPWTGIMKAVASEDTTFVRFHYTTSAPGAEPNWTPCATGTPEQAAAGMRCDLTDPDKGSDVTAVGAISNSSPGPERQAEFDGGSDAQRVLPYVQRPEEVKLSPDRLTIPKGDIGQECSKLITVKVRDQKGRAIPTANVDVHATGPSDGTKFGQGPFDSSSNAQAPEEGHSEEPGHDCEGLAPAEQFIGTEGSNARTAAPDVKHIESTAEGTTDAGTFTFQVFATQEGTTQLLAWVDQVPNDLQGRSEATGAGGIGWGQPPAPLPTEIKLTPTVASKKRNKCVRMQLVARSGGVPLKDRNIDVHLRGPKKSDTSFCNPADASPRRKPTLGGHHGGKHADRTKHAEGETGPNGGFIFGVTSAARGDVDVTTWLDQKDDDVLGSSEPTKNGVITFSPTGKRDITIAYNRKRVRKGRYVLFFGSVLGEGACSSRKIVKLKVRQAGTHRPFYKARRSRTDKEGTYSIRYKMRRHGVNAKVVAPKGANCKRAVSRLVSVFRER
jgi:hypothetical protein